MKKNQSVISFDPIAQSRRKNPGLIGRAMMTRHFGGKGLSKTDAFGHYLFVGPQRSGKTVSALWFLELLEKKYARMRKTVLIYSNLGIGSPVKRSNLCDLIERFDYEDDTIYIVLIDELQSYFPKDTKDMETLKLIDRLTGEFSQLGKRQIYVLSTAQIYGRVNKSLREQCLYMVNCRRSKISSKCVNDFIPGDNIMCDDLGRWSGAPTKIYVHGLPKTDFDTHRMILN